MQTQAFEEVLIAKSSLMLDIDDMLLTLWYPFLYYIYHRLYAIVSAWYVQGLGHTECCVGVHALDLLWACGICKTTN